MNNICPQCGAPAQENEVKCTYCGADFVPGEAPAQPYMPVQQPPMPAAKKTSVSLILGIVGIVMAWLFALVGHVSSIVGIVLGIKEYKETGKSTGLVVSIVGEVCAIISSIIGAVFTTAAMMF